MKLIDKTNGYFFAGIEESAVEFSKIAVRPVGRDYYVPLSLLSLMFIVFRCSQVT